MTKINRRVNGKLSWTNSGTVDAWAHENGISVTYNEIYSDSMSKDQIVAQSITPGTKITSNEMLLIYISKGQNPDAVSSSSSSAVAENLKNKGYTVEQTEVADDTIPAGYIVSQNIDAEDKVVPSKTTVKFKVSTGVSRYTVPDFSGKT
ncbi:PASTA domain-containing protein [Weissella confusa]|uniref:PASTA domain-containing protein n=1 Tax=Weissella confusa TaxID=1583 RepID=A0A923STV1_WEICO|nr:PASTA domain-containing protein [Weissella confusa]